MDDPVSNVFAEDINNLSNNTILSISIFQLLKTRIFKDFNWAQKEHVNT